MTELTDIGLDEIRSRWQAIFSTLQAGGEVSPAQRLRAEGMMQTLVLLGLADERSLLEEMDRCYQAIYQRSLVEEWGEDWEELFPFPQIPGFGQRAPVYPSTRD